MVGKAIAIVVLVPAVLFMALLGPVAIGVGVYEATGGKALEAAALIVGGVVAGAFAWWLTPGMLDAYFE